MFQIGNIKVLREWIENAMLEKIYETIMVTPINKEKLINLIPILKELDELKFYHPAHCYSVLEHSIKAAETLDDKFLRLVMIFHDVGKLTTAKNVPNREHPNECVTKFPNHQLESAKIARKILINEFDEKNLNIFLKLIEYHDTPLIEKGNDEMMEKLVENYGINFVGQLLKIQRADMSTHDKKYMRA